MIEAVVFDLGGVVLGSPLAGIAEYEQLAKVPHNFVNINVRRYRFYIEYQSQ
jgi:hypothetical protein